jgi:hypothetical protein
MGVWGEGPLDNDTAADLELFWQAVVARGRARDPRFWSGKTIAELFRVLYFNGYGDVRPESPDHAEKLLAVGALFRREKLPLPAELEALVESAVNHELRPSRLREWPEPAKRREALEQFLRTIGGTRRKVARPRRRPPAEEIAAIEGFMKRAPHWVAVVRFEKPYDPEYDSAEPAFVDALKHFCFAGTESEDQDERRRAIVARLMCLAYVAGWMLNLPSADVLRLIEAAPRVASPAGPQYAWAAEIFAS